MKKYTEQDIARFERDGSGRLICPTGDYTLVSKFPERCSFGEHCSFGERCSFGKGCSFGECCSFGKWSSFGEYCSFGECCSFGKCCCFGGHCSFGKGCSFGEHCSFGGRCSFGECCSFGKRCSFGEWSSFGEQCSFGGHCSFGERCSFGECCSFGEQYTSEFGKCIAPPYTSGGGGCAGRTTYFYGLTDGTIHVRCGCFAGTLDEWVDAVREKHGNSIIAQEYLSIIPTARLHFSRYVQEACHEAET